MTVPTMTAASPPGMPNGRRTPAVHESRMIANVANAIHGASNIWNAGRIAMNAIEIPASVPSIAARGVKRADRGADERAKHDDQRR